MPDGWEVYNGLNPLIDDASGDADSDGLTNYEEFIYDTDPNDEDSDDDSFSDKEEIDANTDPNDPNDPVVVERFVTDVWGLGADFRWKINSVFGVMGEFYTGQSLGTYNGGALQIAYDDNNYAGIRSTGGWGEFFVYWTPCLHSHFGYGIDDPRDGDIPIGPNSLLGRIENSTVYGNLLIRRQPMDLYFKPQPGAFGGVLRAARPMPTMTPQA